MSDTKVRFSIIDGFGIEALVDQLKHTAEPEERRTPFRLILDGPTGSASIGVFITGIVEESGGGKTWLIQGYLPAAVLERFAWLEPVKYFRGFYRTDEPKQGFIVPRGDMSM